MREQGRPMRGGSSDAAGPIADRPRPNRLSDEARPNVLHLADDSSASLAGPSAVRRSDRPRSRRTTGRAAATAAPEGTQEGQRSSPSLFTILVAGFVVINILRACLQAGG